MKNTSKPPDHENDAATGKAADASSPLDAPQRGFVGRFQTWKERISNLLERAEKHITENFRVPPGGG